MKYFSTKETAELLGYNDDSYIRKLIAEGRIQAEKKGRGWVIPLEEIWRYKVANEISAKHKALLTVNHELRFFVEDLVRKKRRRNISPKDAFCAYALSKGFKTHGAIISLCKAGYGEDAGVLTRTLFELLINLLYILEDPTEERGYRYLSYDWIQRKKMFDYIIKSNPSILAQHNQRISTSSKDKEWHKHVIEMAQKVNKKYQYKNNSWSDKNLREMSINVNREPLYNLIYGLFSQSTHSQTRTMNDYAQSTPNGIEYSLDESDNWVEQVLVAAFDCYSQIIESVIKHYGWESIEKIEEIRKKLWDIVAEINKRAENISEKMKSTS